LRTKQTHLEGTVTFARRSVEEARALAPLGWEATLQSLLQTVYYSLGPGCGALLGGWIWHRQDARFMYRSFGVAVFALFCFRAGALIARRKPPAVGSTAVGHPVVYLSDELLPRGEVAVT